MILKIMLILAVVAIPLAQAQNNSCVIKVVPVWGSTQKQLAVTAGQIKLPTFLQYSVVREQQGENPGRTIEGTPTDRQSAETKANQLSTAECPVQTGPRCQFQIAAPNKVIIKVRTLNKNNQEQSSAAVEISGQPHSSIQDNLNLLRDRQSQLGCNWERSEGQECNITRNFSFSRRAPTYSIQIGRFGLRGLNALTYEQTRELAQAWNNSDGTPPAPACHFSQMPDSLTCSVAYQSGRPVLKYDELGTSSHFVDHESACTELMERVSLGECGMSSPIGDDPCIHQGVHNDPREPHPFDRFGDNIQIHGDAGPTAIR
ncbi:MAG: hypothetical protein A2X86_08845 [Bdellovibrionales bacterium GWA2_49_15]|nr:MAG: hypothetical protein A2X86_08845 [Bdellovibrionales bacterium GWA2_49_15]HAZ12884.1 hypothetical protein [Bdellovibrionales bacterium]